MGVVKRVVELGRALRERVGLKIRQPLRALHVRTSEPQALRLLAEPFAKDLVLGELNVKTLGSLAADDGELCTLRPKANFRTLGKRLGPAMKSAAAAIERLSPAAIAALRSGGNAAIEADGRTFEIGPEDVHISVETRAGFDVETDGRIIVFLDTELDDELRAEGLAREVINRVNGLRKDSGLAVEDRIRLRFAAVVDDLLRHALSTRQDLIRAETLAVDLSVADDELTEEGTTSSRSFDLGEGRSLRVALTRV
jgi:isoleucyl-tRNA synthetase